MCSLALCSNRLMVRVSPSSCYLLLLGATWYLATTPASAAVVFSLSRRARYRLVLNHHLQHRFFPKRAFFTMPLQFHTALCILQSAFCILHSTFYTAFCTLFTCTSPRCSWRRPRPSSPSPPGLHSVPGPRPSTGPVRSHSRPSSLCLESYLKEWFSNLGLGVVRDRFPKSRGSISVPSCTL